MYLLISKKLYMKKLILILSVFLFLFVTCKQGKENTDNGFTALDTLVKKASFQKSVDGKQTDLFTLKNDSGMVVKITNFGARIVSILVPDKNGKYADVAIGYSSIDEYISDDTYSGAIVGRYANRIAKGKFKIDGKEYNLPVNNGPNALHGGLKGFDKAVWDANQKGDSLQMSYTSQDKEEGYPGKVEVKVLYVLTTDNKLKIEYEASTDKPTIINLTTHGYYNLKGEGNGDILDHELEIFADSITPVDSTLIPVGKIESVKGTPFDFTKPYFIGQRINDKNEQLKFGAGYDHNWVLNNKSGKLALCVRLSDTLSGRVMEIYSTEPGIQFYSTNYFNGTHKGKSGKPIKYREGAAFEPQHYPDSPNHANFPSTILRPGKVFKSETVYSFTVKK